MEEDIKKAGKVGAALGMATGFIAGALVWSFILCREVTGYTFPELLQWLQQRHR